MPTSVRVSAVVLAVLLTALAPLLVALSLAASHGWDRGNARSVAFLVTMASFGVWHLVLRERALRQARREVGEELDRALPQHREGNGGEG